MKLGIRPVVVTACALIVSMSISHAQNAGEMPSSSEIEKFAAAALAVQNVVEDYRDEAASIDNQDELDTLRKEYSEALAEAVEGQDISVTRYNEIFQATQDTPAIKEQVEAAMSEIDS